MNCLVQMTGFRKRSKSIFNSNEKKNSYTIIVIFPSFPFSFLSQRDVGQMQFSMPSRLKTQSSMSSLSLHSAHT